MRVLVACEFSGVVRDAFLRHGHDAWSCDLLPCESDQARHMMTDVMTVLDQGWDLMVAHPPCTYLTNAGVAHLHEGVVSRRGNHTAVYGAVRMAAMRQAAAFFQGLLDAPIAHIAVENPVPHHYATDIIGRYDQLIQPWYFGHGETKGTCFWLRNLPPLMATVIHTGRWARVHRASPSPDRWKERSRTLPGIAEAMASQWGSL